MSFFLFLPLSKFLIMVKADRTIQVMGILNLTEDSYFAPSRHNMQILESEADILDIGAISTRPGAADVPEEEEWARLEPVLRSYKGDKPVSVDTVRASIVERCCEALGRPIIVNDISAGEDDPLMLETVGRLGLQYIAMHKRGTPSTMQGLCEYDDVVEDVLGYFRDFSLRATDAGISDWILDPGFGFAKTVEQNYQLMEGLSRFGECGKKILVGISRKSFMWKPLTITPLEALPATQAMHMAALERGADILRVHDVDEALRTVRLYKLLHGCV